ncbi:hypothetical protein ACRAWD_07435 [Caulobacter segnis]
MNSASAMTQDGGTAAIKAFAAATAPKVQEHLNDGRGA